MCSTGRSRRAGWGRSCRRERRARRRSRGPAGCALVVASGRRASRTGVRDRRCGSRAADDEGGRDALDIGGLRHGRDEEGLSNSIASTCPCRAALGDDRRRIRSPRAFRADVLGRRAKAGKWTTTAQPGSRSRRPTGAVRGATCGAARSRWRLADSWGHHVGAAAPASMTRSFFEPGGPRARVDMSLSRARRV